MDRGSSAELFVENAAMPVHAIASANKNVVRIFGLLEWFNALMRVRTKRVASR